MKGEDTKIFALGGLGEVGKNMYCFMHKDEIIITDAGITFPGGELMGIDYVIPDFTFLKKNEKKIKALFETTAFKNHRRRFDRYPWIDDVNSGYSVERTRNSAKSGSNSAKRTGQTKLYSKSCADCGKRTTTKSCACKHYDCTSRIRIGLGSERTFSKV